MKSKKTNNGMKTYFSKIITIVCVGVFIYSVYELSGIGFEYYHNRQVLAEVQEIYKQANEGLNEEENSNFDIRQQFNELHSINPDIVGWVTINGTKINYPVLQAEDNDYYLTRNYKQETSRAGSIFMDYRNDLLEKEKNIILYGHRMKDETMFQQLTKYMDEDFFRAHREVYFDTMYDGYDAKVFSVYYTTTEFDYIQTEFQTKEEFSQLLQNIKGNSIYDADIDVSEDDTILTLSTCDYTLDPDKGRFVVHAKLVERNLNNNSGVRARSSS